jgi:hypothetical protein
MQIEKAASPISNRLWARTRKTLSGKGEEKREW